MRYDDIFKVQENVYVLVYTTHHCRQCKHSMNKNLKQKDNKKKLENLR